MKAPPLQPLVVLNKASVSFGAVPALQGVSLVLHRGERLALVGANGSGKTTLLRLLHGLVSAAAAGQRQALPLQPEGHAAVGAMVFQRPFLLNLPVRWNVLIGLWLQGVVAAQRHTRCDEALRRVGLASLAMRPARSLSGGQQQRLALARAWALKPDILFLDEPTASLDPSAKREVETLMAEFAAEGVTLVFSTHNLGQARRLATRVLYLEGGQLLADRAAERFFTDTDLPEPARQFLKAELPWAT
jgi:tungstate transport system ATP-binding protein